jgi:hypothetical protein
MASIAPIVIECIDYLAYGTIFTRAKFLPEKKLDVFFDDAQRDRCHSLGMHYSFSPF